MVQDPVSVATSGLTPSDDGAMSALEPMPSLPALIETAAQRLSSARNAAEVLDARELGAFAYDAARRAARLAAAKGAHDDIIAAARRAQADALIIESAAKQRLADEYDGAQERGEIAKPGDVGRGRPSSQKGLYTTTDLGLSHREIHDARMIRDAEKVAPGIVKRTLEACVASGEEPTKAALRRSIAAVVADLRDSDNVVPFPAGTASAPPKKSSHVPPESATTMKVPDGATVESQVRKGMEMEQAGSSPEKAARAVNIGIDSYRKIRRLIVLLDEIELKPADRQIVADALTSINETRRIEGYALAEPIAIRVWGDARGIQHTPKTARKRLEHFDTVVGQVVQTCDIVSSFPIPYLPGEKARELLRELMTARQQLDAFMRKIREEC